MNLPARKPADPEVDPRDEIVDHLKPMRSFAMSLTRDPARADDLVQDTVIKAWTKFHLFEPGTNLRAWLFTILRNTFYSERRRAQRQVADVDGAMTERIAVKPAHDGMLAMQDFRKAFEKLPAEQREALILVGAEGFSYQDAAETCGVAVGTIKSRANRGRARLLEILDIGPEDAFEMTDHATMGVVLGNASPQ